MRAIAVVAMAVAGGLLMASPSASAADVGVADVQPGTYRVRVASHPGYCLQQNPVPLSQGPLVGMVPCSDSGFQRWVFQNIEDVATWRSVVNVGSGGCLDADRRGNRLTKVVHVIACNVRDNGSQWWQFPEPPGVGLVCSAMRWCTAGDALVLDVSNSTSGGFGFRVNLWQRTGGDNQNFSLERVA